MTREVWYRYEDRRYSDPNFDDYEPSSYSSHVRVVLRKYPILRHTPKGVWLGWSEYDRRFVLKSARKRFACPTIEEAKESFLARKRRQISIYEARLRDAREAVVLIENDVIDARLPFALRLAQ